MEKQKYIKPRGVIFDFDETLFFLAVDWDELKRSLSKKFAALGYFSTFTPLFMEIESVLGQISRDMGISYSKKLRQEINEIILKVELEGADKGKSALCSKEILEHLELSKVPVGIVSSNSEEVIRRVIKKYKWPSRVTIIGRESVARLKPNIEGVKIFLKKNHLESREVWGVGNSKNDYYTYQKASLSKIFIISKSNIHFREQKIKLYKYKTLEGFYRKFQENHGL